MRFILSMTAVAGTALLIGCQVAASSPSVARTSETKVVTKTTNKTPAEVLAKKSTGTVAIDDGHGHDDDAKRISLADAKKAFDGGNAIFVDTRSNASYLNEHIKGAINIPLADFENRYKELPKGKQIVVYCS